MTPEREAQMREMFHAWLQSKGFKAEAASRRPNGTYINGQLQDRWNTWLACARALDPMVRDGERYRFLFDQSVKTWSCDPLWPLVGFFRDGDETITKTIIDLAIDAALEDGNATD